ncbi:hypothetical protein [Demequina sp. NBRC 110057]|uniref:hypothetical protein n=1 Tax=Demequina sp. NBRC 110057 TaxID=1570346 RepID=UPI000A049442|nr:hypothetical protein [Demequina sp. NBRC 110057]
MKLRTRIAAVATVVCLAFVGWAAPAAVADDGNPGNTNNTRYWEERNPGLTCTKVDPPGGASAVGHLVADGKAVQLDKDVSLLVVKGGNDGYRDYQYAQAGGSYTSAPNTSNGRYPDVSHWIYCLPKDDVPVCYDEVKEYEYQYIREWEGTEGVKEYRWEAIFKKGKELKGWYVEGDNTWVKGDANTWYELPEHKQPERFDGIAPTGTVNLSVYGGPSGKSAPYRYGETYTVYYPGPTASTWTTDGTEPAAPKGSDWGDRKSQWKVAPTEGGSETKWSVTDPGGDWVKVSPEKKRETGKVTKVPADDCYGNNTVDVCRDGKKVTINADTFNPQSDKLYDPATCGETRGEVTCTTVTAYWPAGFDGQHINMTLTALDSSGQPTGDTLSLSWHQDSNTTPQWGTSHTVDFTETGQFKAWYGKDNYRVSFLQVNNFDDWPKVDCDSRVIDICVEKSGGGYEKLTDIPVKDVDDYTVVADSLCEPPVCADFTADEIAAAEALGYEIRFESGSVTNCYYYVFVCWEIENSTGLVAGYQKPVWDIHFPQYWLAEGVSYDAVLADPACGEPVCEADQWRQIDRYKIEGSTDHATLAAHRSSGKLTWLPGKDPSDTTIWNPDQQHWIVKIANSGPCAPPPMEICVETEGGWGEGSMEVADYQALPVSERPALWTGHPEDCFDASGTTEVCTADGQGGWMLGAVGWSAVWEDGAWVLTFDPGVDPDDIVAPFSVTQYGSVISYPGQNLGDGGQALLDSDCEQTPICVMTDGEEPTYEMAVIPSSEYSEGEHTLWTGDSRSCFTPSGEVDLCHAIDDDTWEMLTTAWTATWNDEAEQWDFAFEGDHGEHAQDIIDAIDEVFYGFPVTFDGTQGWQHYLLSQFDCEPVIPEVDIDVDSSEICTEEGGTFSYDVLLSSAHERVGFRLERLDDETWTDLGQIGEILTRGAGGTFGGSVDQAGQYRVVAQWLPSELSGVEASAVESGLGIYTAEFTVDEPTGCADVDGTVLTGVCEDGVPFLGYTVQLNDPYGEVTIPETATLTFANDTEGDGGADYVREIPLQTPEGGGTYEDPSATAPYATITYAYANGVHTWTGYTLWPGGEVDSEGNAIGWPGWEVLADGSYQSVGLDNYGWTRSGDGVEVLIQVNPATTTEAAYPLASPECDGPPPVEICQATDDGGWEAGEITAAEYDANRDAYILWDESMENNGCPTPTEPTLAGSVINSVCVADSPWVRYSVQLNDPDDQADYDRDDPTPVTIRWVHPDNEGMDPGDAGYDDSLDYIVEVAFGEGYLLWPGAEVTPTEEGVEVDPTDSSTFTATNWPGWRLDESGEWVEIEDPNINYGWTRDGVTVRADVNPTFSVTVAYPPPTATCVAGPVTTQVLDAPPVVSEAPAPTAARVDDITYTG